MLRKGFVDKKNMKDLNKALIWHESETGFMTIVIKGFVDKKNTKSLNKGCIHLDISGPTLVGSTVGDVVATSNPRALFIQAGFMTIVIPNSGSVAPSSDLALQAAQRSLEERSCSFEEGVRSATRMLNKSKLLIAHWWYYHTEGGPPDCVGLTAKEDSDEKLFCNLDVSPTPQIQKYMA
ncbi:hypothetical protein Cgig2_000207 [Carnegiea gigantea]|uniref:Uncharacterized protein n=1 Tax=Carnegiea gigantea TaxID=171969 RepID=A0A9Q1KLM5_9CARY|nr:hypothetical protein Cgig2_000207 [Carnegiea gigantea]